MRVRGCSCVRVCAIARPCPSAYLVAPCAVGACCGCEAGCALYSLEQDNEAEQQYRRLLDGAEKVAERPAARAHPLSSHSPRFGNCIPTELLALCSVPLLMVGTGNS